MDLPQAPQDTELRNIIDKLAQFVARNGPDFEQMTKNKQKGNSKFQFLFGGEFFNYYQYKVTTEQAILKRQGMNGNTQNGSWNQSMNSNPDELELEQLTQQQDVLREQIKQSEQNLNAQHTVLLQQQQAQVENTVTKCEMAELQREADMIDLPLDELYSILQPIIDSCTKDSISNGKSWILQHSSSKQHTFCIGHCLLYKVIHGSTTFPQKLHVIYLVNDVLHHCARKNATDLKDALASVVVPMFCHASIGATEEQKNKLDKLLRLWESKANYLSSETVEQMRQPVVSYQHFKTEQVSKYASEVAPLAQQTKATYDGYQAQHQAFVCHAMQQIMELQQQIQALEAQIQISQTQPQPVAKSSPVSNTNIIPLDALQANLQQTMAQQSSNENGTQPQHLGMNPPNPDIPPPESQSFLPPMNPSVPPPMMTQNSSIDCNIPQFSQPPPGFFPPPGVFPDFSKPPPGFPPTPEPIQEELLPSVPYYDLPAGLMVPLIKLEDTSFKPLDPKDIRLPPPQPPNDRLLAAVDAFYSPPTHERPRDSEGWEKLGLYEYYKAKNSAKREKEDAIIAGMREKSRSPSPIQLPVEREPSPPRRRYTSLSPTPSKNRRSKSKSPRRSRRRSRSRRSRRSSSASQSRSRSRTPPPQPRAVTRSPSPPPVLFSTPTFTQTIEVPLQELDSSNKGHQMLRKMGWGGSGLGANEQGIDSPISGGDVRDRQDQFKGVGCDLNDPYENFRKNKGAAFITRMKARAEERANES